MNKRKSNLKKVSMEEYLSYQGHNWGRVNSGGYRLIDGHDSLFVNFNKNSFTWFAKDVSGGIFKLMSELDGITDQTQQRTLLKEIRDNRDGSFKPTVEAYETNKHVYDFDKLKTGSLSNQSRDYLTKTRGINPILVDKLSEGKFLTDHIKTFDNNGKQNEIRNLMFNWKDNKGVIVGSDTQATVPSKNGSNKHQGYFKGIIAGSPAKYHSFNFRFGAPEKTQPDKLVITEAPIDAISYWQMHLKEFQDNHEQVAFVALSGVKPSVINRYISDHYYDADNKEIKLPKEIHVATDNDEVGRKFAKSFGETIGYFQAFDDIKVMVDVPADLSVKDWNDQLRQSPNYEMLSVPISEEQNLPLYTPEKVVDDNVEVEVDKDSFKPIETKKELENKMDQSQTTLTDEHENKLTENDKFEIINNDQQPEYRV